MPTPRPKIRDHGGNLDDAMARFGGDRADWLDLSTGINPVPYPVPAISPEAWATLPRSAEMSALRAVAAEAFGTAARIVPFPGAQAAIQAMPWLVPAGRARVVVPTYNEHAAALRMGGWRVEEVPTPERLAGADLAVLVNPNNPDGRRVRPDALAGLADRVGLMVVDESFVDPEPALSLAPRLGEPGTPANLVVLRSFGKFHGLAGIRLGFALSTGALARRLADLAGPWAVSGPAIEIAIQALADRAWWADTTRRLTADTARLDRLASAAGWRPAGGTVLFRTYETPNAAAARDTLAGGRVWSRIFPYSESWIRLGPPPPGSWDRLERVLTTRGA